MKKKRKSIVVWVPKGQIESFGDLYADDEFDVPRNCYKTKANDDNLVRVRITIEKI